MALDVKVIIDMAKTYGSLGFGYPLVLVENANESKDYAEFSEIAAVSAAGYETTDIVYMVAQLIFQQDHKPTKIAICVTTDAAATWLAKPENMAKEWRQLVVVSGGDTASAPLDIARVIESSSVEKMYFANVDMPANIASATAIEGINTYDRTTLFYYTPTDDIPCPVAALAGELGGLLPGSYTVNNLVLTGLTPLELSQVEIDAIHEIGGITFVLAAGDGVCSEGKVASGEYIDTIDGNDYIKQQLEYRTQKVFNTNLKVPYTNAGIALLESAAIGVMQDAQNKGIIETYTVSYALRDQVSEEDRMQRKYFGGNVQYSMQGAIHEIEIYAQATV